MQTTAQRPGFSPENLEDFLEREIDRARSTAKPVSRVTLTKRLHEEHGLPMKEAQEVVDRYCEEYDPAVPHFLSSEFGTPYLKVLAGLNVLIAISFFVVAMRFSERGQGVWFGLALGGLFLAGGVVAWVNSLRKPDEPKRAGYRRH